MGKADRVLRDVLHAYNISQHKLANVIGVRSSVVYRWFHELIDPTGDTLVKIVAALKLLNINAVREFVQRYLGDILEYEIEAEVDRTTNTDLLKLPAFELPPDRNDFVNELQQPSNMVVELDNNQFRLQFMVRILGASIRDRSTSDFNFIQPTIN